MVPSPCAQKHGLQSYCRRRGFNTTHTRRGDPYHSCRPVAALPPGNAPAGSTPPVAVLERAPATGSATSTVGASQTTSATSATASQTLPDRTVGYLSLSLVPLLWGTYNPCIRYLYAEADPLDPASLTAVRTLLSAGALLAPALLGYLFKKGQETWRRNQQQQQHQQQPGSEAGGEHGDGVASTAATPTPLGATLAATSDGAADGMAAVVAAEEIESQGPAAASRSASSSAPSPSSPKSLFAEPINQARLGPIMTRTFDSVVLGGLELGLLNFLGTALQVEGLHSTSATRAGFLAEVTAVLTPLVSYMAGYQIPRQMWLAVAVGLVGSTMVAYDTSQARDDPKEAPPSPEPAAAAASTATPATPTAPAAALAVTPTAFAATTTAVGQSREGAEVGPSAAVGAGPEDVPGTAAPVRGPVSPAISGPEPSQREAQLPFAADDPAAEVTSSAGLAVPAADHALPGSQVYGTALEDLVTASSATPTSISDYAAAATPEVALVNSAASAGPDSVANVAVAAALSAVLDATPSAADAAADAAASAAAGAVAAISAGGAEAAQQLVSGGAEAGASVQAVAAAALEAVSSGAAGAAGSAAADAAAATMQVATVAAATATPLAITGGEAYLLLACLFYSVCTVRMGIYAPRMDTVSLAAMKKVGLSSMSILWMAATNLQNGVAPSSVLSFPDLSSRSPTSLAVLFYSGLGPGAMATFLQVTGLSTVPATTAQVIYSITPLCTAFFAFLILGGEATGPIAWAGGSLIIGAALMAADAQQKQYKEQQLQLQQQQQQQQQQGEQQQ